jgi:predicted transcriptional regulator YdeE
MAYQLQSVSIRTTNSEEGKKQIADLWQDTMSGKLPILFDSDHQFIQGAAPVSRYDNYESDENGLYDLTIMSVSPDFFMRLEQGVSQGTYKKYDEADDDVNTCAEKAWNKVWSEQKTGTIKRAYSADYESTIPAEYSPDGKAHCVLYIAVK